MATSWTYAELFIFSCTKTQVTRSKLQISGLHKVKGTSDLIPLSTDDMVQRRSKQNLLKGLLTRPVEQPPKSLKHLPDFLTYNQIKTMVKKDKPLCFKKKLLKLVLSVK